MKRKQRHNGAFSLIEYMALLTFIMAALLVSQHFIFRGFVGRWKTLGDSYGQGKQYDPRPYGIHGEGGGTLECVQYNGVWKNGICFDACTTDPCRIACPEPPDCIPN